MTAPTIQNLRRRRMNLIIITSDAFSDTYIGAKDDLIAAGHAHAGMIPELPKRVRKSTKSKDPNADRWSVSRVKGGQFKVTRYFTMTEALNRAGMTDPDYTPTPPTRKPYLRLVDGD